ncbi:MAG TPA: ATP phosphoribosyltransferase regulatory subunit [Gammaproteobacteria bacterium]|nr:ATP phosphoribosyltransferase regulatory subunit [Gammaproteobacteria bacterium]
MNTGKQHNRWVLPDGIEELLPEQSFILETLRRELLDSYSRWGYELITPPFLEFLDSLLTGTGHDLDLSTFRVTDPVTGRQMGLRADMTPQAARIDAHILKSELPVRLCYLGTVLRSTPQGFSGSRAPIQAGCELFGHAGMESVLEVIELMMETIRITGVNDVSLDLGHVKIFRSLVDQAGLDTDDEMRLFDAMQRKANPEIEELLDEMQVSGTVREMLGALSGLNGSAAMLDQAEKVLAQAAEPVQSALAELKQLVALLQRDYPDIPVNIDLAELRGYHYHSGIVFAAFTAGYGEEVARGGRYDGIGKVFGRSRPATGFSADLSTLMGLSVFLPVSDDMDSIMAPAGDDADLRVAIINLRTEGERVIHALPGQNGKPQDYGCSRELVKQGDNWTVKNI